MGVLAAMDDAAKVFALLRAIRLLKLALPLLESEYEYSEPRLVERICAFLKEYE